MPGEVVSYLLSIPGFRGLQRAARPRNRLFRKPLYVFEEYLSDNAERIQLDCGADLLCFLLEHLKSVEKINLLDGDKGMSIMAGILKRHQGKDFVFITDEDGEKFGARLREISSNPEKVKRIVDKSTARSEPFKMVEIESVLDGLAAVVNGIPPDHVVMLIIA